MTEACYGETPAYPNTSIVVNGYLVSISGWTLTPGGSAEDIPYITEEHLMSGAPIYLYPIYTTTKVAIEVRREDGTLTYYDASEYLTAFSSLTGTVTVTLHSDIVATQDITFSTALRNITLDLNGYALHRYYSSVTTYNATLNAGSQTEYTRGDKIETIENGALAEAGGGTSVFHINLSAPNYITFNLKSSRQGAVMTNTRVSAEQWICNGKVVKTTNVSSSPGRLFNLWPAYNSTFNIYGDGITFYTDNIVHAEHGANNNNLVLNIDGGTFVMNTPKTTNGFLLITRGGSHTIKNATLYCNGTRLLRDGEYLTGASFTFENCDIINAQIYITDSTTNCYFNDCRISGSIETSGNVIFGKGTVTADKLSHDGTADGCSYQAKDSQKEYTIYTSYETDLNFLPPSVFNSTTFTVQFTYATVKNSEDCALIRWVDPYGHTLATTYALFGTTAIIPTVKIPLNDGFRAITNIKNWLGEDGKLSDLAIGNDSEYTFTAVIPPENEIEYTSNVTCAMFNMIYYSSFAYNVYIPKLDWVTVTKLGYSAPANSVFIDGTEYWVYTVFVPISESLEGHVVELEYIIEGQYFTAKFKPSAIFYANTIVTDPSSSELEKKVVGNLVRYIEEAYKLLNKINLITSAQFDQFYSYYKVEDYREVYPDANIFDEDCFNNQLYSIQLKIQDGNVSFVVQTTKAAMDAGYKVRFDDLTDTPTENDATDKNGNVIGKTYSTPKLPLRTHIMKTFTVTLVDSNGNDVYFDGVKASSNYSLAYYINKNSSVNITKALYEFGCSVLEYHPIISGNFFINEIKLFGEDIKGYTIATDTSDTVQYNAAVTLQLLLHNEMGYWLEIVPLEKADKSIVLKVVERTGNEGFTASFSEGRIDFASEYSNSLQNEVIAFFKEKLLIAEETGNDVLNLTDGDNYVKNVRDVFYSDFGAVGDGITDDSEAIRACHAYANDGNHVVYADANAKYYIGIITSEITIKTDVHWGNAEFIIDDSIIAPGDKKGNVTLRSVNIFSVERDAKTENISSLDPRIAALNAKAGLAIDASECTRLDLGLGEAAILRVVNSNHKNYVRYGVNQDGGYNQYELVLVDAYGNIDPTTPFMFDYDKVTYIDVYPISDAPITIDGGTFTTIANQAPSKYTEYARGLRIARCNTTVSNVKHYVTGELTGADKHGAPYAAFISPHYVYNINVVDCVFTGHQQYAEEQADGDIVGMGSYDISSNNTINITFKNCIQSNFFTDDTHTKTTTGLWGIMVSNYSKNVTYDGCTLSRFDAHNGVYNVTVKDSNIIYLTIDGGGTVNVENTHYYNNIMLQLRTDYGNFWHGDVNFKNVTMHNTDSDVTLIYGTWYNHDFGYPTALPTNITVDGLKLTNSNFKVNLFTPELLPLTNNIILDEIDGAQNVNKMTPPTTFTIKNSPTSYTYVVPNKTNYPYFKDTKFDINGTKS